MSDGEDVNVHRTPGQLLYAHLGLFHLKMSMRPNIPEPWLHRCQLASQDWS